MSDLFTEAAEGLDSPAYNAAAVTPSDSVPLGTDARNLFVGGAGNITLITSGGSTVTFTGVLAGTILPVRTNQVKATGTTATNIVAMW